MRLSDGAPQLVKQDVLRRLPAHHLRSAGGIDLLPQANSGGDVSRCGVAESRDPYAFRLPRVLTGTVENVSGAPFAARHGEHVACGLRDTRTAQSFSDGLDGAQHYVWPILAQKATDVQPLSAFISELLRQGLLVRVFLLNPAFVEPGETMKALQCFHRV